MNKFERKVKSNSYSSEENEYLKLVEIIKKMYTCPVFFGLWIYPCEINDSSLFFENKCLNLR